MKGLGEPGKGDCHQRKHSWQSGLWKGVKEEPSVHSGWSHCVTAGTGRLRFNQTKIFQLWHNISMRGIGGSLRASGFVIVGAAFPPVQCQWCWPVGGACSDWQAAGVPVSGPTCILLFVSPRASFQYWFTSLQTAQDLYSYLVSFLDYFYQSIKEFINGPLNQGTKSYFYILSLCLVRN